MAASEKGFGVTGDFKFDSKKFQGSGVHFTYQNKEWSIGGTLVIPKDSGIKGIDHGKIDVNYKGETLIGDGDVFFTVPGIDTTSLHAEVGQGGFTINGKVVFKSMPGIKAGASVDASISKAAVSDDFSLSVTGESRTQPTENTEVECQIYR